MNEREQALVDASRELKRAESYLSILKKTKDFDEFDVSWRDFLSSIDRCFNRIEVFQSDGGKIGPRVGKIINDRKKDPLIHYMKEARNTHEHRPYQLIGETGGGFSLGLAPGQSFGYIKELKITPDGNGYKVEGHPENFGVSLTLTPKSFTLLPLQDRNKNVVHPPTAHMKKQVEIGTPIRAAEITYKYYADEFEILRIEIGKANAGISY